MKCFECNGTYRKKTVEYRLYGEFLGKFEALECSKCRDLVFSQKTSARIELAAKSKGVWGIESYSKVGKVGNSLDVKINKQLAEYLHIKKGDAVHVYPESKKKFVVELGS